MRIPLPTLGVASILSASVINGAAFCARYAQDRAKSMCASQYAPQQHALPEPSTLLDARVSESFRHRNGHGPREETVPQPIPEVGAAVGILEPLVAQWRLWAWEPERSAERATREGAAILAFLRDGHGGRAGRARGRFDP
ncbi:MAG: hypothetical protein AAFU80_18515 [Pseudomonadota bacterium]